MGKQGGGNGRLSQGELQMAKLLAQFLHHVVEADKKVETRREVLAEMQDFEPFAAYKTIL